MLTIRKVNCVRCVRVCGQLHCDSSQWARPGVPAEHTLCQKVDVCRCRGGWSGGRGRGGEGGMVKGLYKSGSEE